MFSQIEISIGQLRRIIMNWIFDNYSMVYRLAMLWPQAEVNDAAPAKSRVMAKPSRLLGLFGRRQR
jgi:hypothetical protein